MKSEIYLNQNLLRNIRYTDNLSELDSLQVLIESKDKFIKECFKIVSRQYLGNKASVDSAIASYTAWDNCFKKIYRLKKQNKTDSIQTLIKSNARVKFDSLVYYLTILSDVANQKAKSTFNRVIVIQNSSKYTAIILLIVSTLIVLFFVWYVSRSISNPIKTFVSEAFLLLKKDGKIEIVADEQILLSTLAELKDAYLIIQTQNIEIVLKNKQLAEANLDLEEKIKQRTFELSCSNKDLEQFAFTASHDLQEPLRMISSYTQLLERRYKDKLDQDANDYIHFAVDGALRMQKLLIDLLEFSRVNTRAKSFLQVDTSTILGQVILNLKSLIDENTALITNNDLPVVPADESQILRVFQNLIENAIKFRKKTELPKIHISCTKQKNRYQFSVADNGIGIDMQYHDRVFIIFQRLHSVKDYPGTGIGLSICKRIVERHGGTIWIESKENEGTTFYFTIPV